MDKKDEAALTPYLGPTLNGKSIIMEEASDHWENCDKRCEKCGSKYVPMYSPLCDGCDKKLFEREGLVQDARKQRGK